MAVVIAAGISIWRGAANLLPILAASIYFEIFTVQGTTISRLLAPLAVGTVVVQLIRGRVSFRADSQIIWVAAYVAWAVASGLWTINGTGTLHELSSLAIALAYMAAFATLIRTPRDLDRVLFAWACASMVSGLISFPRVSAALGFGTALKAGRSQGVVGDPNEFAAVQLVTLPLILVIAGEARKRRAQIALGAAGLTNATSIVTALSRGGFIGFTGFVFFVLFAPARFLFTSRRSKAIALAVLALGVTAVGVRNSSTLSNRVEAIWGAGTSNGSKDGSGRIFIWNAAWLSVQERPWLGLGYGAWPSVSNALLLRTQGVDFTIFEPRRGGEPVLNAYLESLAELGILGPILYAGILLSTALALRRTARRAIQANEHHVARVAYALIVSLVTWAITSTFLSSETARALWIVVGLSLALPKLIGAQAGALTPAEGPSSEPGLGRGRSESWRLVIEDDTPTTRPPAPGPQHG